MWICLITDSMYSSFVLSPERDVPVLAHLLCILTFWMVTEWQEASPVLQYLVRTTPKCDMQMKRVLYSSEHKIFKLLNVHAVQSDFFMAYLLKIRFLLILYEDLREPVHDRASGRKQEIAVWIKLIKCTPSYFSEQTRLEYPWRSPNGV